jgi:glutamyl-tRNA synthetase
VGVNRANAVVNFNEADPFDPKAVWLNAEHIRALPVEQLAALLLPVLQQAGPPIESRSVTPEKVLQVAPLIRERIRLLRDAVTAADFFFAVQLPPYDCLELIPPKGDAALARKILAEARELLAGLPHNVPPNDAPFDPLSLETALRAAAERLGLKAGPMFQPIRVAVCGRKNAPPLFETMAVLGRELCLERISQAIQKLEDQP